MSGLYFTFIFMPYNKAKHRIMHGTRLPCFISEGSFCKPICPFCNTGVGRCSPPPVGQKPRAIANCLFAPQISLLFRKDTYTSLPFMFCRDMYLILLATHSMNSLYHQDTSCISTIRLLSSSTYSYFKNTFKRSVF